MKYKLIIKNDHLLTIIDNKYYLIDTGCPFSFNINDDESIKINNKICELRKCPISINEISTFIGIDIYGYLGTNTLASFKNAVINKKEMMISFNENIDNDISSLAYDIDIFNERNHLICFLNVNNHKNIKTCLDTGAHLPLFKNKLMINKPIDKRKELTHFGYFNLNIYESIIKIQNGIFKMESLEMNRELTLNLPYDAFIGINQLFDEKFIIDFESMKCYFR